MEDKLKLRPRRRSRGSGPKRRRRAVLAAMLGTALLLTLGNAVGLLDEPPAVQAPARTGSYLDIDAPVTLRRANYNHSVIPGGAFNGQELKRAVNRDAVVAQHYSDVDPSTMRPEILKADRLAYVSYRLGDRVYWTSKKVRIRSGETILTNGQTEIRARCGNCISMEPLMPTSADEPDPMQLDALTDTGPVLVSWPLNAFGALPVGGPVSGETAPVSTPLLVGLPFPFGAAPFASGPIAGGPSDTGPGSSTPGGVSDSSPGVGGGTAPGGVTPPGGITPPLMPGAPVPGFSVDDSSGSDPLESLLDNPTTLSPAPPTTPVNATAIPEPATILLLGGGIAGLIARRWRSVVT